MASKVKLIAVRTFSGFGGRKVLAGELYECHPTVAAALRSSGKARDWTPRDAGKHGPAETKPHGPAETKAAQGAEPTTEEVDPLLEKVLRLAASSRGLKVRRVCRREDGATVVFVEGGRLESIGDGEEWVAHVDGARGGEVGRGHIARLPKLAGDLSVVILEGGLPAMVDLEELGAKEAAAFVKELDSAHELERYRKQEAEGKGRKTVLDAVTERLAALAEG